MKTKCIISSLLILLISFYSIIPSSALAEDNMLNSENELNFGFEEDPYSRLNSEIENNGEYAATTKYDPRSENILTEVKNQNSLRLCWMYATMASTEQYISKNYGSKFDISEVHGAVALSDCIKKSSDILGYYTTGPNCDGTFSKAAQYLTNWNSPIFNSNIYSWNSVIMENDYPTDLLYNQYGLEHNIVSMGNNFTESKPVFNVTSTKYIAKSENTIKYAIQSYGSVLTSIYMSQNNFIIDENSDIAYISNSSTPNHVVTIVGWDDTYSKENFNSNSRPENNGAWLIKNSWGTGGIKKDGYMWISYDEPSLDYEKNNMAVITGAQKSNDNEYMLSYDYFPIGSDSYNTHEKVYLANVYDISDYTNEYDSINKVMTYIKATNCTYNLRIVQLENNTLPSNIEDYSILASGEYSGEGYLTIKLDNNYYFNSNNKCAIILELIPNRTDSQIFLPSEKNYYQPAEINLGESFYYIDNNDNQINWSDCITNNSINNFCLRPVLTKNTANSHYANISPTNILNSDQDTTLLIDSDSSLFCIHTNNNKLLREDKDYYKDENGNIVIKSQYINSLNDTYTEIVLEFSNNITKTIIINPKSVLNSVTITGKYAVGQTLTAINSGTPVKDNYNVNYQWQSSLNGNTWYDIANATSKDYTIKDIDFLRYLRVRVTAEKFGNVVYPTEIYSNCSTTKTIIFGDVNLDGVINSSDITKLQKYISSVISFSDEQKLAADVNGDGYINTSDITLMQKYIANIINIFPVQNN